MDICPTVAAEGKRTVPQVTNSSVRVDVDMIDYSNWLYNPVDSSAQRILLALHMVLRRFEAVEYQEAWHFATSNDSELGPQLFGKLVAASATVDRCN